MHPENRFVTGAIELPDTSEHGLTPHEMAVRERVNLIHLVEQHHEGA